MFRCSWCFDCPGALGVLVLITLILMFSCSSGLVLGTRCLSVLTQFPFRMKLTLSL